MKNSLTNYSSDDFVNGSWLKSFFDLPIINSSNILKTNIKRVNNSYLYEVDVPGYDKNDISISYDDGYLIIEAKVKKENISDNYIRKERYSGTCSRSFYIGEVDESKITAKYDFGVIYISVPDEEKEYKNKKEISIK